MVAVDEPMEDFKFVLTQGRDFVSSLLPIYQGAIRAMSEEDRNEFFKNLVPLNNWQLSVILTYSSLLEKMLEVEMEKEKD